MEWRLRVECLFLWTAILKSAEDDGARLGVEALKTWAETHGPHHHS